MKQPILDKFCFTSIDKKPQLEISNSKILISYSVKYSNEINNFLTINEISFTQFQHLLVFEYNPLLDLQIVFSVTHRCPRKA